MNYRNPSLLVAAIIVIVVASANSIAAANMISISNAKVATISSASIGAINKTIEQIETNEVEINNIAGKVGGYDISITAKDIQIAGNIQIDGINRSIIANRIVTRTSKIARTRAAINACII